MNSKILLYPHNSLARVAEPLTLEYIQSDNFRYRISSMFTAMYRNKGVGLAAPQIGWNARVFIGNASDKTEHSSQSFVFINPEILAINKELQVDFEGCLSIPDLFIEIPRYKSIVVRALNLDGKEVEVGAKGYLARIIQHEYDHLDGLMMLDRADKEALEPVKKQLLTHVKRVKAKRRRREMAMRKKIAQLLRIQKARAKNKKRRKRKRKK